MTAYLLARRLTRRFGWNDRVLDVGGTLLMLLPAVTAPTVERGVIVAVTDAGLALLVIGASRWLLRGSLAAYLATVLVTGMVLNALTQVQTSDGWLIGNGFGVIVLTLAGVVGLVLLVVRRESGPRGRALEARGGEETVHRVRPMSPPPLVASSARRS
jgi:hypothetical protein